MLSMLKNSPFRQPSWRADRAMHLIETRRNPSPKLDDKHVRSYLGFIRRWLDAGDSPDSQLALYDQHPGLFMAHVMHYHPDGEWASMVQARLLTRANDDEIAKCLGCDSSCVAWYEHVFFQVRDRLTSHDWIVKAVMGPALSRRAREDAIDSDRDLLYKLFGYFGGPLILQAVISGFSSQPVPQSENQISAWFDQTYKGLIRSRATQAARCFHVNRFNVMELLRLHLDIIGNESDGPGIANDFERHAEALLAQTRWTTARKAHKAATGPSKHFATSAVEPRAAEQLLLASGHTPSSLTEKDRIVDLARLQRQEVAETSAAETAPVTLGDLERN